MQRLMFSAPNTLGSKPLSQMVAQSIESSNNVSDVQVCDSFRKWWYATKNTHAII
jgi:hypothetical protein